MRPSVSCIMVDFTAPAALPPPHNTRHHSHVRVQPPSSQAPLTAAAEPAAFPSSSDHFPAPPMTVMYSHPPPSNLPQSRLLYSRDLLDVAGASATRPFVTLFPPALILSSCFYCGLMPFSPAEEKKKSMRGSNLIKSHQTDTEIMCCRPKQYLDYISTPKNWIIRH